MWKLVRLLIALVGVSSLFAGAVVCPGDYFIHNVTALEALSNCTAITGDLGLYCPTCTEEDFLKNLDSLVFVQLVEIHEVGAAILTFSNLEIANYGITVDATAVEVHFPKLVYTGNIMMMGRSSLTTFDAPMLEIVSDYIDIQAEVSSLSQFNVPHLKVIGAQSPNSGFVSNTRALAVLDLPELQLIRWAFGVQGNVQVINMPKLELVSFGAKFERNPYLMNISSLCNPHLLVLESFTSHDSPKLCCSQLKTLADTAYIEKGLKYDGCAPC
ncbi:hypothetical protein Pelo_9692 [Pelomyxa schiedti]|nr:hypothetical protein Pelo_9692 [Pelomyxa schiedti]